MRWGRGIGGGGRERSGADQAGRGDGIASGPGGVVGGWDMEGQVCTIYTWEGICSERTVDDL